MKDKLISDRQVIKAILDNKELFKFPEDIQRFAVIIEDLPSMDRPQGKWIETTYTVICGTDEEHKAVYRDVPTVKCSNCGNASPYQWRWKYCPYCGARMKKEYDEKECHKPESQSYRAYCEEWKDEVYCEGCKFWY